MKNTTKEICLIGTNNLFSSQLENRGYKVNQFGRNTKISIDFNSELVKNEIKEIIDSQNTDKFIILSGFLQSKKISEQSREEIIRSFFINSIGPTLFAEYLFDKKNNARLIIIGSESGFKGSYDLTYALGKSSLKMYVKQKKIKINQQLLLLSPSTISDFGMTFRRNDKERLESYKENHPKKRFLSSDELSELIINLFSATNYLTNEEIKLHGGKFSLMN